MKLEDQIQALRRLARGPIIEPQDAGYDQARKVYNAMIDKRPRLIVQCAEYQGKHPLDTRPQG